MKKLFAVILVIGIFILASTSWMTAQAEAHVTTAKWDNDTYCKTDDNGVDHYYVFVTRDSCDYTVTREVSRTLYFELLAEEQASQEYHDNLWYVKAWNWTTNAANDVADFVVFWN